MKDDEMERARDSVAKIVADRSMLTDDQLARRIEALAAQQPEGWRKTLEKISALTVTPISEDHAAANNGKEVVRAKAIARCALAPAAMLDVAPIPGEEK